MRELRRTDRTLDLENSRDFLEKAWVGRMATAGPDGPYVTPLSFAFAHPGTIYFHSAHAGHKIDNIAHDARVCFEVDECSDVIHGQRACNCSVKYRSVLAFGQARRVENREERVRALDLLVDKYAQIDYPELTDKEIDGVTIIAIDIDHLSGKSNR